MKLTSLHMDRFGARRDLRLADFTDNLNVVYGPNGSGKTTIIQFIRWMMFGDRDEISRRYLKTSDGPAAGSMSIRDEHGLRRLERHCQSGSLISQLMDQETRSGANALPVSVSNAVFDKFFVVSFDRGRNIGDLIHAANTHGLQLHVDERRLEQARQLRERIEQQRAELTRYGYLDSETQLRGLRDQKQRDLDSLREDLLVRQQDLQQQRHELMLELSDPQSRVDRLRNVVTTLEQAIENRKRQLDDLHQQWLVERESIEDARQQRLAEIDRQLHRWQDIQVEVRGRLEEIRVRQLPYTATHAEDPADLRFFVRQLGGRLQDIEQDLAEVHQSTSRAYELEAEGDYLRRLLGSALNSMRNELSLLGRTMEQQQQASDQHELREEVGYLSRVEKELSELVDALHRQRDQLASAPSYLDWSDRSGELDWGKDTSRRYASSLERRDLLARDFRFTPAWSEIDDFRLRHLADRREAAVSRLHAAEMDVAASEQRLRHIEAELERTNHDARFDGLEQDIRELDARLRERAKQTTLERSIAELEEQWRRMHDATGSSQTVSRASTLLRQLTEGEYTRIEVSQDHRCKILGRPGFDETDRRAIRGDGTFAYDYSQLSRGVQDQVYLAMVLAIVETLSQRGTAAPLILNDVFSNLDHSGNQTLSAVLEDFARHHQTFVFTRHDHIRDLFRATPARVFTLREDHPRAVSPAPRPHFEVPPATRYRPVYDSAIELTPPPTPKYKWVAEWQDRKPATTFRIDEPRTATPFPVTERKYPSLARTDRDVPEALDVLTSSSRPHRSLSLNTQLSDAPLLGDEFVGYMKRLNVETVGEFLDLNAEAAARELAAHGITVEIVERRQRELLMLVYVGVDTNDAQLLVACGVPDPARLARADEAVLLKRVETVLSRPQAADRFGGSDRYGLNKIRRWIQAARDSKFSQANTRKVRFRSGRDSRSWRDSTSASAADASSRSVSSRSHGATRDTSHLRVQADERLRFYLELNDHVVDAPTIGPKTAEKLHAVGVFTVTDLLQSNADTLADRLGDKRISAEIVQQWQLQAELVCSIPNLRGHDAQILVGCGVEDAVTLASLEPSSLLPKVTRFVESKEGQRLLRNNAKPDLAEVTAWIQWAESARQLRAA